MNVIYYGEIQNMLNQYHNIYQKNLTFSEAAILLYEQGRSHSTLPKFPDFSKWDVNNIDNFCEIHKQTPVFLDNIIGKNPASPDSIIGNDFYPGHTIFPLMIPQNAATHCHSHNYFEIDYILSGSCEYFFENETRILHANDLCILPPNVYHDFVAKENCIIISINLKKEVFDNAFFYILKDNNPLSQFFKTTLYENGKDYLYFVVPSSENTLTLIKHIFIEFYSQKSYSNEICLNYLEIFFAQILRDYSHIFLYDDYKNKSRNYTILPALLEYIRNNYKTVTLTFLAEYFNYDKAYLGKLIKQYTGSNFNDIVNHYKLKQAVWLLENTPYKIEEISYMVGYNHVDYFFRCFKKENGVSPSQFRKTLK